MGQNAEIRTRWRLRNSPVAGKQLLEVLPDGFTVELCPAAQRMVAPRRRGAWTRQADDH